MAFVTFCIPTIWRDSLQDALDSLEDQTHDDWQCVVIGDGNGDWEGEPAYLKNRREHWRDDGRIHFGWVARTGSAGLTRNMAIRVARLEFPSQWIAFLDDDDAVSPFYVENLRNYHDALEPDVVVSRMFHPNFGVLPDPYRPLLEHGHVGISFAVRNDFLPQDPFIKEDLDNPGPNGNEDIQLIKRLQGMGAHIFISPTVDYYVRPGTTATGDFYER